MHAMSLMTPDSKFGRQLLLSLLGSPSLKLTMKYTCCTRGSVPESLIS